MTPNDQDEILKQLRLKLFNLCTFSKHKTSSLEPGTRAEDLKFVVQGLGLIENSFSPSTLARNNASQSLAESIALSLGHGRDIDTAR